MKLKYQMELMDMGDSSMAVPVDCDDSFRGILQVNGTTADILELLKNDVTEEDMVAALKEEYDATEEQIRRNIQKVLGILREYGLLFE